MKMPEARGIPIFLYLIGCESGARVFKTNPTAVTNYLNTPKRSGLYGVKVIQKSSDPLTELVQNEMMACNKPLTNY